MDKRSEYLIQLLEKIGAPLMEAIADVSTRQPQDEAGDDAKKIAALLAKTVQVSIDIGKNMDLASQEDQGESIRVALAALAGSVVAEQYKHGGQVPDDQALARITGALQAVMTFSENFIPSEENTERLKQIKAQGQLVDARQTDIQYIQAFIPAVNAIGNFSFGQPEQKLVQEVADRLTSKAMVLRESIFAGSLSPDDQKRIELALLRSLASIYAECHRAETSRLTQFDAGQNETGGASMAPVWAAFDVRAAMLETLGTSLAPQNASSGTGNKAPAPAEPQPTTETPPTEPPAQPVQPPAEAGSTPLSMFAKPKDSAAPPTQTPEAPPAAPETPPQPEQPLPPAEQTAPPPTQQQQDGDPMSFFKSGDNSEKK
ncbi:MAG: hypothetical protein DHS20C02_15050 [Micavibrio sp.]|nr:MAG: hypothetical protein DHS20C02_15050 [Micavibrio sp.]